jgi:uncharacterized membrane protein (Fun14 family)
MQTWQPLFIAFLVPVGLFFAAVWLVGIKPAASEPAEEIPRSASNRNEMVQIAGIVALVGFYLWALRSEFSIVAMVLGCAFLGYYYATSLWTQLKANGLDDLPRERKFAPIIVGLVGTVSFMVWAFYLQALVHGHA